MFQSVISPLGWLGTAPGLNCLFAALCVAAACGLNVRIVMWASAALYVAMACL